MKIILKLILISALLFLTPLITFAKENKEDIAEELLNTPQNNEIVLRTEDDKVFAQQDSEDISEGVSSQEEQNADPDIMDNAELDFEIFKNFDHDKIIVEDSLFGKIYHSKITRTDIPTYLLQDDLTFQPKKGPVDKIQLYAGFNGSINSLFNSKYTTKYNNSITQVGVYGAFKNPDYKFKFGINPIPTQGINYLDKFIADAYIMNTSIPHHQIVVGYSRVQTGIEGGTTSYTLPFVTRSQIARNFGGARSLSAKLIGNYEYIDYNLSAGSSGRYVLSGMPGTEFNGWVNVKPFGSDDGKYGKLTLGGGFNCGHNRIDYNVASAYIGYKHKKLWTNIEAAIADGYNGYYGTSSNKASGFAFTAGWKFTPHIQLIGRIDQFDPNRKISHNLQREYSVGINWFIKGQALKVVLNYVFCQNQNIPNSHKIILATQILI